MSAEPATVPVDAETLARALEGAGGFRVLRRMRAFERRPPEAVREGSLVGVALDCETTGRDSSHHQIIELALQRFLVDPEGRIVGTGRMRSWLEQPPESIPAEITAITGISNADVYGRQIAEEEAVALMLGSDFAVSHNAAFDRPFVERRLPAAAGRAWCCSLADFDWAAEGCHRRDLDTLLSRAGLFHEAHRAATDVAALLHVLDRPARGGGTVVGRMLARARRPSWTVDAAGAPFGAREVLRERGYRWDPRRRLWSVSVGEEALDDEVRWASLMLYGGSRRPAVTEVAWTARYAARP